MELRNSSISINPQISPGIQFLTWTYKKIPPRLWRPSVSSHMNCKISNRIGRPNIRQNYLRKKLTQEQQLLQRVSHSQHLLHKPDKSEIGESNIGVSSETVDNINKPLEIGSKGASFSQDDMNHESDSCGVCNDNSETVEGFKNENKNGEELHFIDVSRSVSLKPCLFSKRSRVGFFVLCCLCLIWRLKGIFSGGKNSKELTTLEKEMLRRKMRIRAENEKVAKGSVEIMKPPVEPKNVSLARPMLNTAELVNSITKAKESYGDSGIVGHAGYCNKEQNNKIKEIRAMASHARQIEKNDSLADDHGKEDYRTLKDLSWHGLSPKNDVQNELSSFLGKIPGSISTEADNDTEGTENSEFSDRNEVAHEAMDRTSGIESPVSKQNWLAKNFHEFEPIVEKMGVGFKENYLDAKGKAYQKLDLESKLAQLKSETADSELEWMEDERLSEIVFKVRDNELSGRDPFNLMDEEDKRAFFSGLEKKVQQENVKLLSLHEYLHSNIENLDYGADGISLYDPPEKIIPRWKVPPAESNPEFLKGFVEQKKSISENLKNSVSFKKPGNDVHKSEKPSYHQNSRAAENIRKRSTEPEKDNISSARTIIQGSDGSIKAGKKSGMEFWEHTKRWSEGFLKSYNAETDPEVKAIMKDMGKGLDRWITEKEIQEAADVMDRIPEKGQKFIKEKLDKVKREMELFGPQAVVSKYREYGEDKEVDYLWWLDLPCVLCIELYTVEDGEERVGLYSLEMAADLELDPKQHHVIAFEHAGDCKNLCYIVQAHLEMLGNGNAFVVARPPKDAFREAKANGFGVTVIRKGGLQLNIDQTLEEVEEFITEIGSKIYHDKIAKEHSVNINGLMTGVFGVTKPAKRRKTKRKSRRHIKA